MYKVVPVTSETLPDILEWFSYYNYDNEVVNTLSDTGFLCYKDEIMCAAGWVYLPLNSKWVFYDNLITNPFISSRDKVFAVDKVMDACVYFAEQLGCKYHFTSANKRLGKRISSKGFNNSLTESYIKRSG